MKHLLRIFFLLASLVFLSSPCYPQAAGHYVTRKPKPAQKKSTTPSKPKTQKATPAKPQAKAKPSTRPTSPSGHRGMSEAEKARVIRQLVNNMVYVEGGTFMMGATTEQVNDACRVTVNSYYIGKYEVTQREWEAVMGQNPSRSQSPYWPVIDVSWNDCQDFIAKLNHITGNHFRLPSGAEWEFAARGGNKSQSYKFAGSNNLDEVAWYIDNSGGWIHNVGTKRPNELGLYDMNGNVFEWCSDATSSSGDHLLSGGAWSDDRCAFPSRSARESSYSGNFIGLRLVLNR